MLVPLILLTVLVNVVVTHAPITSFASKDELQDHAHMQEHLKNKVKLGKLSEEKRRFYYFMMYDLNLDGKLDGTDIVKALNHHHDEAGGSSSNAQTDDQLVLTIDNFLNLADVDHNGYVDFAEYSTAMEKETQTRTKTET